MEFDTLPVVILVGGMVLLYGAITNRNPVGVIKAALTGGDLSKVDPIMGPSTGLLTQTIPGTAASDPSEFHSNGSPRANPDGSPHYANDPWPLPPGDPKGKFKPIPPAGSPGDPRAPKDANRPRPATFNQPFNVGGNRAV